MAQTGASVAPAMSRELRDRRLIGAAVAIACAAPLITGLLLTPATQGHGTHEQLGLPACGWLLVTGYPCATCGMTTAVTLAAHGHLLQAFRVQPAGALFAVVLASGVWFGLHAMVAAISPKPLLDAITRPRTLWLVGAVLLAAWAYKIVTF